MAGRRDGETLSGSSEVCQGVLDPVPPRSYVRPTVLTARPGGGIFHKVKRDGIATFLMWVDAHRIQKKHKLASSGEGGGRAERPRVSHVLNARRSRL
jgi:hypothetical protein